MTVDRRCDVPADAEEARLLTRVVAQEDAERLRAEKISLGAALTDARILALSLVYFGIVAGLYSLTFWTPQIVKAFGLSNAVTGLVAAVPFLAGSLIMPGWGRHSDRTRERVWHVAIPCFVGAAGLIAGTLTSDPYFSLMALTLAAIGIFAGLPTFWTLPTSLLSGASAAAGIALINSIGNLGGFAGPYAVGWLKERGLTAAQSIAGISSVMLIAGIIVLLLGRSLTLARRSREAAS